MMLGGEWLQHGSGWGRGGEWGVAGVPESAGPDQIGGQL